MERREQIGRALGAAAGIVALVAVHGLVVRDGWLPIGPLDGAPGQFPGSDWDWMLQLFLVGEAAADAGVPAHWNPFPSFGEPLLGNPQSTVSHPLWRLLLPWGWRAATWGLFLAHVGALCAGLALLARRIGLPAWTGIAAAAPIVTSYEWVLRLSSGHWFIVGLCLWPLTVWAALEASDSAGPTQRRILGWLAGACLGSVLLAGGHYTAPIGAMLLVWVALGAGRGGRGPWFLAGLLIVPVLWRDGPTVARIALELGCLAVAAAGLLHPAGRRERAELLAWAGLGLLALGAGKLLGGVGAVLPSDRISLWSWAQTGREAPPLTADWVFHRGALEGYLHLQHPLVWLALLFGALALGRRVHWLGAALVGLAAAAWSSGLPLKPWTFATLLPGTSAMQEQMRLQLPLLVFAPLGLLTLASSAAGRLGARAAPFGASVAAAALLLASLLLPHSSPEGPRSHAGQVRGTTPARIVGTDSGASMIAVATQRGLVTPSRGVLDLPELPAPGGRLAWPAAGEPDDSVEVVASLAGWTVTAAPRSTVILAQRWTRGWRCDLGAKLETPSRRPAWVQVELGDGGRTTCRWRTPGRGLSRLLALLGWIGLALPLGARWRARSSGS